MTEGVEPPPSPDPAPKQGKVAGAKAGLTRAQAAAQARFDQLQAARNTNQLVDTGFHFYERDLGAGGGVLAGALAFRLFIFAVPYVFVVLTAFGSAAELQNESGQDAARSAGLTGLIAKSVADAQRTSDSTKIISLVVGIFAVVLAARTVVKTLRAVHALAWRVPLTRLRHSTRAAVVLILVVLSVSLLASLIGWVRSERPGIGVLLGLSMIVVWSGAWLVVSWLLPHAKRVTALDLVPGSLLFGLVVWLMHLLTVFYFSRKVSSASDTYGAIGAAIGILLALYLVGRAMSASAVLNATLWERKQARELSDGKAG